MEGSPEFYFGEEVILSSAATNILHHLTWYNEVQMSAEFINMKIFNFLKKD